MFTEAGRLIYGRDHESLTVTRRQDTIYSARLSVDAFTPVQPRSISDAVCAINFPDTSWPYKRYFNTRQRTAVMVSHPASPLFPLQ
jgi:hypothetical protein